MSGTSDVAGSAAAASGTVAPGIPEGFKPTAGSRCAAMGSSMSQKLAIQPPWQMPIGLACRSSTRKPSWKRPSCMR